MRSLVVSVFYVCVYSMWGFSGGTSGKEPANTGDLRDASWIPGLGITSGGGHGNPFQYSCLENPLDRGTWQGYNP